MALYIKRFREFCRRLFDIETREYKDIVINGQNYKFLAYYKNCNGYEIIADYDENGKRTHYETRESQQEKFKKMRLENRSFWIKNTPNESESNER